MNMILAWAVFPLLLALLALGCGLLLELIAGVRLKEALLMPCGVVVMIVTGALLAETDATAELATGTIVALAIVGFVVARPWLSQGRRLRPDRWAAATAAATFVVFAAPVVLSGEATFAGYIKLDDTATWFALSDNIAVQGRHVQGLDPSSFEATVSVILGQAGYPIGAFVPLVGVRPLVGQDIAWLFQPYLTFLIAMLALILYELAGRLIESRPLRALVAFIAAQPALLFGYGMWGAIKELTAVILIALLASLVLLIVRSGVPRRVILLPAAVASASVAVLGVGGLAWIGLPLLGGLALMIVRRGLRDSAIAAGLFCAATALLSIPTILQARSFLSGGSTGALTAETEFGNLIEPLNGLQVLGIWPIGDFRIAPDDMGVTYVLVSLVALSAIATLVVVVWRRKWDLFLYMASTALACFVITRLGSAWIDGKALATAAPAFLLAGMLGAALLLQSRRRVEGTILIVAIAAGVLWSNALAFNEVSLAPRGQLAELQAIGKRIAGQGPALMTEYEPYGARHFLRKADGEGASELRRRVIPLRTGKPLDKSGYADIDQFDLAALLEYRTLVLRRSAATSKPPAPYRLIWKGRYYEVWQRPIVFDTPLDHLPLGDLVNPVGTPRCADVDALAQQAGPNGRLVYVERPATVLVPLSGGAFPNAWSTNPQNSSIVIPKSDGTLRIGFSLPRAGDYLVWLGGSLHGRVRAEINGQLIGRASHQLNNFGQYVYLGSATLAPGKHQLELRYDRPLLRPGSGGAETGIGPVLLAPDTIDTRARSIPAAKARELCGRELDWIEAVD